ncbi:MAG: hypothetical protein HC824_10800 [Synechococcales cyanobacterium RM1_1_8]|nr:hypothetical protein [Synechococcales cyanobacterium RM1_1_8]
MGLEGGRVALGLALSLAWPGSAWAAGFVLCGNLCTAADPSASYFVGYGRSNHVELAGQVADLPLGPLVIYPQVADFQTQETVPNVDEQRLAVAGHQAQAIHRIDQLRIGEVAKSEALSLSALPPDQQRSGKIKATAELVWGDTLHISSKRLPQGSPLALQIERTLGGQFLRPATDYVNYRLSSQTWVNGRLVPKLDYQLARFPGPGEGDRAQGKAATAVSVLVKVGEAVTLESRFRVEDGVRAADDAQVLDGQDSMRFRVTLLSDDSCARSDSGLLTTGDCD